MQEQTADAKQVEQAKSKQSEDERALITAELAIKVRAIRSTRLHPERQTPTTTSTMTETRLNPLKSGNHSLQECNTLHLLWGIMVSSHEPNETRIT
jgi:hypothetical protein